MGTLAANPGFDGSGDIDLLNAAASSLAVGASGMIDFTVRITLNGAAGPFFNTALVSGMTPPGGLVNDTSDDGNDPDPNGIGNGDEPGENDPTKIDFPPAPGVHAIPTLPQWGLILLALLLAAASVLALRQRRQRA